MIPKLPCFLHHTDFYGRGPALGATHLVCIECEKEHTHLTIALEALERIESRHHADTCQFMLEGNSSFSCNCHKVIAQTALKELEER